MKAKIIGHKSSFTVDDDTQYRIGYINTASGGKVGNECSLVASTSEVTAIVCQFATAPTVEQAGRILQALQSGLDRIFKEQHITASCPWPIVDVRDLMQGVEGIPPLYVEPQEAATDSQEAGCDMQIDGWRGSLGNPWTKDGYTIQFFGPGPEYKMEISRDGYKQRVPTPDTIPGLHKALEQFEAMRLKAKGGDGGAVFRKAMESKGQASPESILLANNWKKSEQGRMSQTWSNPSHPDICINEMFGESSVFSLNHWESSKSMTWNPQTQGLEDFLVLGCDVLEGKRDSMDGPRKDEDKDEVLRKVGWDMAQCSDSKKLVYTHARVHGEVWCMRNFWYFTYPNGKETNTEPYQPDHDGSFFTWLDGLTQAHCVATTAKTLIRTEQPAKINTDAVSNTGTQITIERLKADGWLCVVPDGFLKDGLGILLGGVAPNECTECVRFNGANYSVERIYTMEGLGALLKRFTVNKDVLSGKVESLAYRQEVLQALGWESKGDPTWVHSITGRVIHLRESYSLEKLPKANNYHDPKKQSFAAWAAEVTDKAQTQAEPATEAPELVSVHIERINASIQTLCAAQEKFKPESKAWRKLDRMVSEMQAEIFKLENLPSNA
jgi:hypothetical protein